MGYYNNEHYADPTAHAGMKNPDVWDLNKIRRGTYGYIEFWKSKKKKKVECIACGTAGFCFLVDDSTKTYTPRYAAYNIGQEDGWRLWTHDPINLRTRTPWKK